LDYADSLICSALALEPDNPAYIDSYGWLLYKRGDYELALEHLLRAEKLAEPMDPVILEHIGQLYEKLNNKRLAIEYYERALELNPSMETSYERLKFLK